MVSNEDGILQTSGSLAPAADGTYSATVSFKRTRDRGHEDGRDRKLYRLTVSANDNAGNQNSASSIVAKDQDRRDHDDDNH